MDQHLISIILFVPLFSLILILFLPKEKIHFAKHITLATTLIQLIVALAIYWGFESVLEGSGYNHLNEFQFVEKASWFSIALSGLGTVDVQYLVGLDGLNVTMVLLCGIVLFVGAISSYAIDKKERAYFALYLLLCTSVVGCFVALDFFLFFLFFEFMLLPMYFLIAIWGGKRREYASIKFFIYTLTGSVLILIVMIGLYSSVIDPIETGLKAGLLDSSEWTEENVGLVQASVHAGEIKSSDLVRTFNMVYMTDNGNFLPNSILSIFRKTDLLGQPVRIMAFLALLIGFIIKLPSVPFHTWLPDAHVEAPTPISVVLAGILLKIGAYGLIRIGYGIFPDGAIHYSYLIAIMGVISIIYGALNALAMKDLKKMVAYSSVSHMGFVLLGMASMTIEGVSGAIYQMFSHGIISAALFVIAGVIYDRTKDRGIENYRGIAEKMPYYTGITAITFFAALGLPGFSGFIGEILVFFGAFNSHKVNGLLPVWPAVIATFGLLVTAAFFLWTLQRMFFGKYWTKAKIDLVDLTLRERMMLVPLVILMLVFGIFPSLLTDLSSSGVVKFCETALLAGKLSLNVLGL